MTSKIRNYELRITNYNAFLIALVFLIKPQFVNSQDAVEVFGYFESTLMGSRINNNFYQLNTNKLRVDLKSDISEQVSFAANFDYINYNGKTSWNILDFLSKDITSKIPEGMQSFYIIPFHDQNFLDNAYIKIALKDFFKY